jgi:hypothetical protein
VYQIAQGSCKFSDYVLPCAIWYDPFRTFSPFVCSKANCFYVFAFADTKEKTVKRK